jgi:ATP-dependent Lon protease
MTSRPFTDSDPVPLHPHRLADALGALPLFPLPQVVLFPRAILPLHVFEPRYRAMLEDCLRTHGALAVVQLSPAGLDSGTGDRPPIASIAGAGLVIEHEPLPDGRWNILVQGTARVALEELPFEEPYRRARATVLEDGDDVFVPEADVTALLHAASSFAAEVRKRDPAFSFRVPELPSPGALADLCAFHLVISPEVRQAVLADLDPKRRVLRVLEELSAQRLELGTRSSKSSSSGGGGAAN